MEAGKLRHVVQVERRVEGQNAYGETVVTWTPLVSSARMSFTSPSGRDYMLMDKPGNVVDRTYTCRRDASILPGMRINHGGDFFYITAVLPDPTDAKNQRMPTGRIENV